MYIKEHIPSSFSSENLKHLKEEYELPNLIIISEPNPMERVDSDHEGWVCFHEITFKIGVRLPLHPFTLLILNHF